ncbi:hypothetical protein SKAU_G00338760 [Synaphobranchus kaupii]|uniref:Zinc finger CCCH domain-containing protein 14 n=1 Tax=Synaphobranchus kaupii TaxID=118154 RepID=A0A9Q1EMI5_SYNKA|nr:hypothetical protein SKAU_G00338760 [Synaphobranchus kaupii]
MEPGTDLRKYLRAEIKRKLQELGPYVDEELTDYIMVLVANKKSAHQMAEDLSLFLGRNSIKFTVWLHGVLEKLRSVDVEPGLPRPHYLQADFSVSIGNGEELGQANRGGEELQAPTLSSVYSNSTDSQFSISSTLEHHRWNGLTERSMQHVLHAVQPLMGHLYSDAGLHVEPELSEASPAALTSRPGQKAGVTDPCGLGWPSQGTGRHGSPSQVPGGTHGYRSFEAPWDAEYVYRRLQDSRPAWDEVARASKDSDGREEVMSWRWEHQTMSSIDRLRSNTVSEVRGPNDAYCFIPRKPPVGGSVRSKLTSPVGEEVSVSTQRTVQGRWDEGESQSGIGPKFIVTLDIVPSTLKNVKDDDEDDGRELYYSDEEGKSVGVKRRKVPERCRFWPACESGDKCLYHHPITQCKTFPHCSFGDKCLFIHPNCKYNDQCTRLDCPYTHSSKRGPTSLSRLEAKMPPDLCHFFPECKKMDCQFYHPKPCRFTTKCKRADCYFYHPPLPTGHTQVGQIQKQLNG